MLPFTLTEENADEFFELFHETFTEHHINKRKNISKKNLRDTYMECMRKLQDKQVNKTYIEAVSRGDIGALQQLYSDSFVAMEYAVVDAAAKCGYLDCVLYCLEHKCPTYDSNNMTCLTITCLVHKKIEMLALLLDRGYLQRDKKLQTCMIAAIAIEEANCRLQAINLLLQHKYTVYEGIVSDAVYTGDIETVKLVLYFESLSSLDWLHALRSGSLELCRWLEEEMHLEHTEPDFDIFYNSRKSYVNRPEYIQCVKYLLEIGFRPSQDMFYRSLIYSMLEMAKLFYQYGCKIDDDCFSHAAMNYARNTESLEWLYSVYREGPKHVVRILDQAAAEDNIECFKYIINKHDIDRSNADVKDIALYNDNYDCNCSIAFLSYFKEAFGVKFPFECRKRRISMLIGAYDMDDLSDVSLANNKKYVAAIHFYLRESIHDLYDIVNNKEGDREWSSSKLLDIFDSFGTDVREAFFRLFADEPELFLNNGYDIVVLHYLPVLEARKAILNMNIITKDVAENVLIKYL
jgi:hypothetical protein